METEATQKRQLKLKDDDAAQEQEASSEAGAADAMSIQAAGKPSGRVYTIPAIAALIALLAFLVAVLLQFSELSYYKDAFPVPAGAMSR